MSRSTIRDAFYYAGVGLFAAATGTAWGMFALFAAQACYELADRTATIYLALPVALIAFVYIFENAGRLFGPREGELTGMQANATFEGPYRRSPGDGRFFAVLENIHFIFGCLGLLAMIVLAVLSGYDWLVRGQYVKFGIVFGIGIASVILSFRNSWFLLRVALAAFIAGVLA